MQFELASGERPVGDVMLVLGRRQVTVEPSASGAERETMLSTDYVLYSSDQGDGGILAIKEEEDGGIELFAITELQSSSPVLDFCAQEPTLPGRDSLYVCSGLKQEGSLKRVRSGIPAESSGSGGNQFFAGATGLWNVKENQEDGFDSFLVVSFVQSTTLMKTGDGGSLEDISESCGLDLTQATVSAGRLKNGTIFQAHRTGVIAVDPRQGTRYSWSSTDGVITSAYWAKENTLVLGQISSGESSLLVLELVSSAGMDGLQAQDHQFKVVSAKPLSAEPTAIHCWQKTSNSMETEQAGEQRLDIFCCVGTLEPAVIVYQLTQEGLWDLYNESLAQAGRESVAIPHAICILKDQEDCHKILVGLRDGSVIAYDWNHSAQHQSLSAIERGMCSPRLFKLGVLPVKFVFSHGATLSQALILSDNLWQASFDHELQIQPILFDSEVSQACSFGSGEEDQVSRPSYIFIVDHHDMQLVTLDGARKYNYQTMALGQTPRRILDITSKRLLLTACVGDGFPFAPSTLLLIDPQRASNEPGSETQHIVAEFSLKQGEAVYCLVGELSCAK
ncbi:hypothetical protein BGZ72_003160 [Mortierella alpina]|nr:hypothetical protein BGZ72_003160 [Mortierella alpina]